jgi:hypothetical protein
VVFLKPQKLKIKFICHCCFSWGYHSCVSFSTSRGEERVGQKNQSAAATFAAFDAATFALPGHPRLAGTRIAHLANFQGQPALQPVIFIWWVLLPGELSTSTLARIAIGALFFVHNYRICSLIRIQSLTFFSLRMLFDEILAAYKAFKIFIVLRFF